MQPQKTLCFFLVASSLLATPLEGPTHSPEGSSRQEWNPGKYGCVVADPYRRQAFVTENPEEGPSRLLTLDGRTGKLVSVKETGGLVYLGSDLPWTLVVKKKTAEISLPGEPPEELPAIPGGKVRGFEGDLGGVCVWTDKLYYLSRGKTPRQWKALDAKEFENIEAFSQLGHSVWVATQEGLYLQWDEPKPPKLLLKLKHDPKWKKIELESDGNNAVVLLHSSDPKANSEAIFVNKYEGVVEERFSVSPRVQRIQGLGPYIVWLEGDEIKRALRDQVSKAKSLDVESTEVLAKGVVGNCFRGCGDDPAIGFMSQSGPRYLKFSTLPFPEGKAPTEKELALLWNSMDKRGSISPGMKHAFTAGGAKALEFLKRKLPDTSPDPGLAKLTEALADDTFEKREAASRDLAERLKKTATLPELEREEALEKIVVYLRSSANDADPERSDRAKKLLEQAGIPLIENAHLSDYDRTVHTLRRDNFYFGIVDILVDRGQPEDMAFLRTLANGAPGPLTRMAREALKTFK